MKLSIARGGPMSGKDTNPKDAAATSKVPLWLLSPIAKAHWAVAQYVGLTKYGAWNWRAVGVRASVYLAAMQRHFDRYLSGEDYDEEGVHNLGAIMACAAIILDAWIAGKLIDDRPPRVDVVPVHKHIEGVIAAVHARYADKAPRHYTIADSAGAPDTEPSPAVFVRDVPRFACAHMSCPANRCTLPVSRVPVYAGDEGGW